MRRAARQQQRPARQPARSQIVSLQPPVRGLMLDNPPSATDPLGAEVMENWLPTERGCRVRGGLLRSAIVPGPVTSLFTYKAASSEAIFAATETGVYDISALDPNVAPGAEFTGQTSGYYSSQQIGTGGGTFLYIVNGTDSPRLFDGSSWTTITGASSPAITGVTTSELEHVWLYRNRLFFTQTGTLSAWYLPVDSLGGAALDIGLAGIFQRGGSLVFGATWSMDSGSGMDDKCVFVSSEGEVAIYEGSDPSDPNDWLLVGRYDVASPLGRNATMQAGGDLLIATVDGIVPLSQVIQKDPAALSLSAVSKPIERLWGFEAIKAVRPVEMIKWAERALGLVTLPDSDKTLAVNLQTGAWAVQTGWVANCTAMFSDTVYIGREDGTICAADEGGLDDGIPFTARLGMAFSDLGAPTQYKRGQMLRCSFLSPQPVLFKASLSLNYTTSFPTAPDSADVTASSEYMIWDISNWDEALWWSEEVEEQGSGIVAEWRAVSGTGYALAPAVQITSGSASKLNVELVKVDMALEVGGSVV